MDSLKEYGLSLSLLKDEHNKLSQWSQSDDAVKFTSEMHDPCAQTVTYKGEKNKNTLQKAPVWSWPNTLRRLSQKSSYNSRVLEMVNYAYLHVRRMLGLL